MSTFLYLLPRTPPGYGTSAGKMVQFVSNLKLSSNVKLVNGECVAVFSEGFEHSFESVNFFIDLLLMRVL